MSLIALSTLNEKKKQEKGWNVSAWGYLKNGKKEKTNHLLKRIFADFQKDYLRACVRESVQTYLLKAEE